jgi:hypothetical protein
VSVLFSISPKPENAFKFTTMAITWNENTCSQMLR